jgi:hypothetical protein
MKPSVKDPKAQEQREARRSQIMLWTIIIGCLGAVWLLYDNIAWVRSLLGTKRGNIGIGIWIIALPLILLVYLLQKHRK